MDTLPYSITNLTVSADYHNAAGQVWNTTGTPAWESWTSAHYNAGDYSVSAPEEGGAGTGTCRYSATTPTALAAAQYKVMFRRHVDGTAANDVPIGAGSTIAPVSLAATGLDAIAITSPAGRASTFAQMIVQLYRRFFSKSVFDGATIKTYADDGTTLITSQTTTNAGGSQTVGPA